ncbi:MAG: 50S ribosomal protein L22 [Patescibacteria group bacterium]
MIVKSIAKNVPISPRKVRTVAALVRGRSVADALTILEHTPRKSASAVAKTIKSAQANATNNHDLKGDSLVIDQIFVTTGRKLKRYRPAAHGRALPYQKKQTNIYVHVTGEQKAKKPAKSKKEAK